jgi:hypothetical protein
MPVVQSALQLKALFKEEWENFAAQAGAIVTIGPPGDIETAEWARTNERPIFVA